MKNINKTTIIVAVIMLVTGLALGAFMFNGQTSTKDGHDHRTENVNQTWTCSMHPQVRKTEAGQCPICGMDLIPINTTEDDNANPMAIKMSPTAMQLANVQTAIVQREKPTKSINLNGKIQPDERYVSSQTSHISGRIEKLLISYTGEYVKKGQVIAYIYSPELVNAQEELFVASRLKNSQASLFIAAKEKLKNWKLTDKQIDRILKDGKPKENFPILSDLNGVVMTKKVNLGDHIKQGEMLFEIADLSRLWVLFDIYESDMSWIKIGDKISYKVQSIPGETFTGKVSFIDPVINPKTRVAQARISVLNSSRKLKPEMFVSATLKSIPDGSNSPIVIPKSAVMWTGKRSVVYVKTSEANGVDFMMREVVLGAGLGDAYIVSSGLMEGEEIAIHGTFSIDAAAQLAGKPSMMNPEGGAVMTGHNHGGTPLPSNTSNHSEVKQKKVSVNTDAKIALKPIYDAYFNMKDALTNDKMIPAQKAGEDMINQLAKINMSLFTGDSHDIWMKYSSQIEKALQHISHFKEIEEVRQVFMQTSNAMIGISEAFQPLDKTIFKQFCPMADDNKGADWLSLEEEVKNPYFGASMLTCGEVTEVIK